MSHYGRQRLKSPLILTVLVAVVLSIFVTAASASIYRVHPLPEHARTTSTSSQQPNNENLISRPSPPIQSQFDYDFDVNTTLLSTMPDSTYLQLSLDNIPTSISTGNRGWESLSYHIAIETRSLAMEPRFDIKTVSPRRDNIVVSRFESQRMAFAKDGSGSFDGVATWAQYIDPSKPRQINIFFDLHSITVDPPPSITITIQPDKTDHSVIIRHPVSLPLFPTLSTTFTFDKNKVQHKDYGVTFNATIGPISKPLLSEHPYFLLFDNTDNFSISTLPDHQPDDPIECMVDFSPQQGDILINAQVKEFTISTNPIPTVYQGLYLDLSVIADQWWGELQFELYCQSLRAKTRRTTGDGYDLSSHWVFAQITSKIAHSDIVDIVDFNNTGNTTVQDIPAVISIKRLNSFYMIGADRVDPPDQPRLSGFAIFCIVLICVLVVVGIAAVIHCLWKNYHLRLEQQRQQELINDQFMFGSAYGDVS